MAREIAHIGVPDYVLEHLLDEWRATDLDLTADSRVVELDGRIVAHAIVHGPITVVDVAPQYEDRGFGALLFEWAQERECELGRSEHRQWIGCGNQRGKTLLQAALYELGSERSKPRFRARGVRGAAHREVLKVPVQGKGGRVSAETTTRWVEVTLVISTLMRVV